MARDRAQEAEADGQGSHGGADPARLDERVGLKRGPTRPRTRAVDAGTRPSRRGAGFRGLTHLSAEGDARMVDVSAKAETSREAVARAIVRMTRPTIRAIRAGNAPKGDVLGVARTAGILAAKRTPELIPLCHPLRLTGIDVTFDLDERRGELTVESRVRTVDKTGVEMEALTAAAAAALTIYDMVKALEKGVVIAEVKLMEKTGGKSGHWTRATSRRSR